MSRNTHHPGNWVEDVAQDALEGDTQHRSEQCVQRSDQGDEADQHRSNDDRHFEACQNVFTQHFEEALAFVQVRHLNVFFAGVNTVRVDQRQNDKGAEHVQNQRGDHVFWFQHCHVCAHDRHGNSRHCGSRHGVHAVTGHFAEDIFIRDKVLRLTQNQGADCVERFQFTHAVHFG
ncbi:hypothetical protein D3C76_1314860 [compost metagenome]